MNNTERITLVTLILLIMTLFSFFTNLNNSKENGENPPLSNNKVIYPKKDPIVKTKPQDKNSNILQPKNFNSPCLNHTIMSIVAHEDDDLLFMNPNTDNLIHNGSCLVTVYLTAGDDGNNSDYWLGRQKGSEAAYSKMMGSISQWTEYTLITQGKENITIAKQNGNNKITLIYMHLPDGNLNGNGFITSQFESLSRLYSGAIKTINTIDNKSSYTSDQLTNALSQLMNDYQPIQIWAQSTYNSKTHTDHPDHISTGLYTKKALDLYVNTQHDHILIPIKYYLGYTVNDLQPNLNTLESNNKAKIFTVYANHDSSICKPSGDCTNINTYNSYFYRQYNSVR